MTTKKTAATLAALTVGALAALPAAFAQVPAPPTAPAPPMRPGTGMHNGMGGMRGNEAHPAIQSALRNLDEASHNLSTAKHDFGGHREKALDLVQRAIAEAKLAMQDDKR